MRTQDRLLDAHVGFVLRELTGDGFTELVRREIDWAVDRADDLTLDQVIDRSSVAAVAVKYATQVFLAGAIPDVAGEIASRLRTHPANDQRLDQVLPRPRVEALVAKLAEFGPMRRRVATLVAESPVVQVWLADYLRTIALWPVATNRRIAGRVPGVNRALALGERVGGRLAGGALTEADQRARELSENVAATLLQQWGQGLADGVDDDDFAEALLSVWDQVADRSIRELLDATDDADLIDLIVLVFETWMELRDGTYVPALIELGVDYVFDTYGAYPLSALLEEFGVTRADLVEEAVRFGPRALTALAASGDLEVFVRRQLARFYDSPEAEAALTG
ncbi:hypothetical protein [uncultured Jatrophihabitans sp.]|uniref:hypothetical protein n=1 Tax=uncultured Jatrophihabitans sp. TaxID=1610747 RepID=UPI0035C9DC70